MCKLCGVLSKPILGCCDEPDTAGSSDKHYDQVSFPDTGANPEDKIPDHLFSDDENEKKFISDLCWIKGDHWIHSEMKWNTIHGIPWKRMNSLGKGGFGSVFLGMRNDKKLFAVKSIVVDYPLTAISKVLIKAQVAEIKMLRYLRSKYIVRCLGCGRSRGENGLDHLPTLDVFMEFAARGSLLDIYKARGRMPFDEDHYIKQYTYDILKALQYLQKKRVVHGDLKMSNILLTDDCVKLTDWGGSKQLNEQNLKKLLIGTVRFQAPEVSNHRQQSYPADIFSLGCTVIEMATGEVPTRVRAKVTVLDQIHHRKKHEKEDLVEIPVDQVSRECRDFLERCLCHKPEDRWTAAELLHHPFITTRDKTSKLPYRMKVHAQISHNLLQPPRQLDPELPDEPVTARVYKHLTGANPSWVANLAGCGPNEPQLVFPPSPKPSNVPPPNPLPPLAPDLDVKEEFPYNLIPWLLRKKKKHDLSEPITTKYISPRNSKRVVVPTPIGSPQSTSTFAVQKISIDPVQITVSDEERPARVTEVEAKETCDVMLESATVMREANISIFESARMAPDDNALELFPLLKKST